MIKKIFLFTLITGTTFLACKTAIGSKKQIIVMLEPKSNTQVTGSATFTEKNGVVTFEANIKGLTPGEHAIHIHEKADCSAADASSAGGHWNPTFQKHGKWGQGEYHKGDIGNFTADANGNGTIQFSTDEWCMDCGDKTKDITNKGLIVHKGVDDITTQPTGNAGGRVACTGIIK